METIVALATARGQAGVAVVRVSGPRAWDVCKRLTGRTLLPRRASLCKLRGADNDLIDEALVLLFEAGQSFTGERIAEFQVHGSAAVISALLREILSMPGLRTAEAGEFTRRAFQAGVLDLAEVEGLSDLLRAETEAQRKQAQKILSGSVRQKLDDWREDLVQALSMVEACMDFADEDIPDNLIDHVLQPLDRIIAGIGIELAGRRAAESLRDGFEVAIVGKVNAGKSTLLNALAGREAAITSEWAGTTRDVIEVRMDIGGLSVTLIDTAGLRETDDAVEKIGIARGRDRAAAADLRVYLLTTPDEPVTPQSDDDLILLSKCDVWGLPGVSGKTGEGVSALVSRIESLLSQRVGGSSLFSHARHFDKLTRAMACLSRAHDALNDGLVGWELVSEDIRLAMRALDGIVGRIDVEDVLGRIFATFCIGK